MILDAEVGVVTVLLFTIDLLTVMPATGTTCDFCEELVEVTTLAVVTLLVVGVVFVVAFVVAMNLMYCTPLPGTLIW